MFCCLGLIAALVVGAFTGLGLWLIPVGLGLGLIVDIKVLRGSKREEGQKKEDHAYLSKVCCWLPGVRKRRIKAIKEDITGDE